MANVLFLYSRAFIKKFVIKSIKYKYNFGSSLQEKKEKPTSQESICFKKRFQ